MAKKSKTFVVENRSFEGKSRMVYVENRKGNFDMHLFMFQNFKWCHVSYDLDNMTSECFKSFVDMTNELTPNKIMQINANEIETLRNFYKAH